jgi:hypothetical protein
VECLAWVQLHVICSEALGEDQGNLVGLAENTVAGREVGGVGALAAFEFSIEEGLAGFALSDLVGGFAESYQVIISVGEGKVSRKDETAEGRISEVEDVREVDDEENGREAVSLRCSDKSGEGWTQLAVDPGAKSGF